MHLSDADIQENLSLLASEHGDYRNAVEWFKDRGKQVSPFLINALGEERTTFLQQGRIIQTLGELREAAAIEPLVTILRSGRLSWEAAQALGKIGSKDAEEALLKCLDDERLTIVRECTKALGQIRSDSSSTRLQQQLHHDDALVRCYAVQSLIQIKPAGLSEVLSAHLIEEQDGEVRRLIEERPE